MLSTLTFTKPPYIAYRQMSYVLAPGPFSPGWQIANRG
jgi:hypothetical protein